MDASASVPRRPRLHPPFVVGAHGVNFGSIELYIDDLPLIDDFVAEVLLAGTIVLDDRDDNMPSIEEFLEGDPELDADGWALASWQSYDWSSLAALGSHTTHAEQAQADAVWTATDWSSASGVARRNPESHEAFGAAHATADEVAVALDAIARQIRSGELSIDQFRGTPPEAALAAALAAMLKLRR